MRKNYLNIWSRLTAVLLVAMLVPVSVSAQKFVTTRVDDASRIRYNFYEDESTGEIYALVGKDDYNTNGLLAKIKILKKVLISPSTPMEEYAEVRGVEEGAFEGCTKIERVEFEGHDYEASLNLPYYRYEIGAKAFKNCKNLELAWLDGVKSIGDEAFMGCSKLKVSAQSNLESLGAHCFKECTNLSEFMLYGDIYMKIGVGCFENCTSLKTVQLHGGLKTIPDEAFKGCTLLGSEKDFEFPKDLKRIGDNAFEGCGLKTVALSYTYIAENGSKISNGLHIDEIGKEAFINCNALDSVDFGYTKIIGEKAFTELPNLRSIYARVGLEQIDEHAFYNCKKLESVKFLSLKTMGYAAFQGCESLSFVSIDDEWEPATDKWGSIQGSQFQGCQQLKKIKLPETFKVIPSFIFYECGLEEMEWPKELTTIEGEAFEYCHNLQKVDLSQSKVETIGKRAFSDCFKIAELNLGTHIKSIGSSCCARCTELRDVTVPESCDEIGAYAFAAHYEGTGWESYDPNNTKMQLTNLYLLGKNIKIIPVSLCEGDKNLVYVKLPPELETIEKYAFRDCNIKALSFPATLGSIGQEAFENNNAEEYWASNPEPQPFGETIDINATDACPFVNFDPKTGNKSFTKAVLYIPKGTRYNYCTTRGWRMFSYLTSGGVIEYEPGDAIGPVEPSPEPEDLLYHYEDGKIEVCISPEAGDGYDEEEKCLKYFSFSDDADLEKIFSMMHLDFIDPAEYAETMAFIKSHFCGVILQVVGKGKVVIDYKALGTKKMWVKKGNEDPEYYPNSKDKTNPIAIDFNYDTPTLIWIYPKKWENGEEWPSEDAPQRRAENSEDVLKLYSLKVAAVDETGIETVTTVFDATTPVFDLTGRRVNENNLVPGIYVRQGQKMIVK